MLDASYDEFISKTGCMQKCNFMKYEFVDILETDITWNTTKWISEFYLLMKSDLSIVFKAMSGVRPLNLTSLRWTLLSSSNEELSTTNCLV